jgi:hypothetical protein
MIKTVRLKACAWLSLKFCYKFCSVMQDEFIRVKHG